MRVDLFAHLLELVEVLLKLLPRNPLIVQLLLQLGDVGAPSHLGQLGLGGFDLRYRRELIANVYLFNLGFLRHWHLLCLLAVLYGQLDLGLLNINILLVNLLLPFE